MKRNTFKICFYIQKTRIAKDGQAPILLRVTVNGGRAVISVNLKVNPQIGTLLPDGQSLTPG